MLGLCFSSKQLLNVFIGAVLYLTSERLSGILWRIEGRNKSYFYLSEFDVLDLCMDSLLGEDYLYLI
jgi:hypothetical protein